MKQVDYASICTAVAQGRDLEVEHQITHQHGRVIACDRTGFAVATADGDQEGLQYWERTNCEPGA